MANTKRKMRRNRIVLFNFARSLLILWLMLWVGKGLSALIPIGISESIWGLLALFACLSLGIIQVKWIETGARFLMRYMTIFFLPICVGILDYKDQMLTHLQPLFWASLIGTFLMLIVIGLFSRWVFRKGNVDD